MPKAGYLALIFCILFVSALGFFWQNGPIYRGARFAVVQVSRPARAIGGYFGRTFSFFGNIFHVNSIAKERDVLRKEVAMLSQVQSEVQILAKDNLALSKDLALSQSQKEKLIPCRPLSYGQTNFIQTLTLNCGESLGVSEGFGVVFGGVLVGVVSSVSKDSSTVRLITSAKTTIDVNVEQGKTSSVGVVRSSFASGLILDLVPAGSNIGSGDLVVTSGVSGKLTAGLLIGRVGVEISDANTPQKQFTVEPFAKWRDGSYAVVVRP